MKTKHIKVVQGLIAVIFVFATAYFILGIMADKKAGPEKAQKRFDTFMLDAGTIAAKYEPNSPGFNGEFTQLITKYRTDFAWLRLDVNNNRIYEYPEGQPAQSDVVTTTVSSQVPTVLGNTLTVTATMYALTQSSIYRYAKISFLLILAGTLAAVILLLIIQITAKPHYRRLKTTEDTVSFEEEPVDSDVQADEEQDEEFADDDFDPISEMEEENRESADDFPMEAQEEGAFEAPETDAEPSLPVRSQLLLEKELQAAISKSSDEDTDLSLLIVSVPALKEQSAEARLIAGTLIEKIGNQGNVYHFNDGFTTIIRNTNLDTALATAQALYTVIDRILQENGNTAKAAIGLSSRSERIITSQRLITEAEQAVLHAANDSESPIIAFRVNPEKYREFMQNNG